MANSGKKANASSKQLFQVIETLIINNGYVEFAGNKNHIIDSSEIIGGKQYAQQVPIGTTIYNTPNKAHFFLINKQKFEHNLVIEARWQQQRGSADQKFPYFLFNILKLKIPTVIVLDGDGYQKAAVKWLKDQVLKDTNRPLKGVFTLKEFMQEINNGFIE